MVFQEYALFPWITVAQNVAFGLEIKKLPKEQITEKVNVLLDKLHLQDFRERFPKDLSGGMKQRVAIARVLALDSPMMLMDDRKFEGDGIIHGYSSRTWSFPVLQVRKRFSCRLIYAKFSDYFRQYPAY